MRQPSSGYFSASDRHDLDMLASQPPEKYGNTECSNPSLSANNWIRTLEIYQAVRQATGSRAGRNTLRD